MSPYLAPVGVRPRVRHGEQSWAAVFEVEALVVELVPVYADASSPIALLEHGVGEWRIAFSKKMEGKKTEKEEGEDGGRNKK